MGLSGRSRSAEHRSGRSRHCLTMCYPEYFAVAQKPVWRQDAIAFADSPGSLSSSRPYPAAPGENSIVLKLLFLVSHSSAGGAQEIWSNLAEDFRRSGADVKLLALYPLRETVRGTSDELPWQYVVPKRPSNPVAMLTMLRNLAALFRKERPDAVFTAMPAANILAAIAAFMAGLRDCVVISHHSPVATHNPVLNFIDGMSGSLPAVKAVVSVSNAVGSSLDGKPAVYRRKRRTIYNALPPDVEELVDRFGTQRGASSRHAGRTIIATGRLAPQKNYPMLLRAMQHLDDCTLRIVGNGPDEAMLRQMASDLGVADRVTFMGHVPRAQALAAVAEADVFAQVSLFEGHSLALIEAARIGVPIVVSDVPVQIEGVTSADGERCAAVVPCADDKACADALNLILSDSQVHAEWAERSRKLGAEASWNRMVSAYRGLLNA